jgi:hypothetical protein
MVAKKRMDEKKFEELSPEMKQQIEKIDLQMDATQANLAQINVDTKAEKVIEGPPQVEFGKDQIKRIDAPYIKPTRCQPSCSKPKADQESLRKAAWEYVKCVVENKEIRGESIQFWYSPPISGEHCWEWIIPVNRPVWIPRMIKEHLQTRSYNRIVMDDSTRSSRPGEQTHGAQMTPNDIIVVEKRQRIGCRLAEGYEEGSLFNKRAAV